MLHNTFLDQYISTRHPNSPRPAGLAALEEVTAQFMAKASIEALDHQNTLYCLGEGIIQPEDFPADRQAI